MEYEIHTTKKTFRKYRVHIVVCLLVLAIIGVIIAIGVHKPEAQSDQQDEQTTSSAFLPTPGEPTQPAQPTQPTQPTQPVQPTIQERTETTYIKDYKILNTYVREGTQYYTQGLMFKDPNTLLESTGLLKESAIHYLSFPNMTVLKESTLGNEYFGEGCEIIDNKGAQEIYQLTWQNRKIFVWDAKDLKQKRILDLPRKIAEGWGIAKRIETDDNGNQVTRLYITDGSSNLYVVDPITMKVLKTIPVKQHNGQAVSRLNELEFIKGYLWANIYMSNNIAVINVDTGYVDYMVSLSGLDTLAKQKANEMGISIEYGYVLNGIAYDSTNDRLIIAGKKWPLMWQIQVDGIN